jgi:hypothetical protein
MELPLLIDDDKPMLVQLAQRVIDDSSCLRVCSDTGDLMIGEDPHDINTSSKKGMLLDLQSAQVVVQCYDAMTDKGMFQRAINKIGACRLVHRLWGLYSK